MRPPWMSSSLLLVSLLLVRLTEGRVRPLVPPPPEVLEAEGINPPIEPFAIPIIGAALPRNAWTAIADSTQDGNTVASNVLDGNPATIWHTEWAPVEASLPHTITIDMNGLNVLDGITYLPRQDGNSNGNIGEHQIFISVDGETFTLVAYGTWLDDNTEKSADFEPTPARYIRIVALTEAGNRGPWASAAEINAYGVPSFASPNNGWTASADSTQDIHVAGNVLDGDASTYWHTEWTPTAPPLPHMITIDMQIIYFVDALGYNPRQDGSPNGNIGQYQVLTSTDGNNFNQVISGTWNDDQLLKLATFPPVQARYIRLVALSEAGNRGPWSSASEISVSARTILPRTGWIATADSFQDVHVPNNVLDNDPATMWHTEWAPTEAPLPHMITIDMQAVIGNIDSLYYLPRQDGSSNGNIGNYQVFVSVDGITFNQVTSGTWPDDASQKAAFFVPTSARYIRLIALTEAGNRGPWSSATEINISNGGGYIPPPNGLGKWGPTINFPLVPVAATIQPFTGKVVVWSSWSPKTFSANLGQTVTALFDPLSQTVTQRIVTNTGHDMFCPGISIDALGRTLVTGGDTSQKASIYNPGTDSWSSATDMNIPRGYQSSATCSNGRIFTIGGSWSGGLGGKNGEIYDPNTNTWTLLPGCPVDPMLTNDAQGVYRQDNHGWLFGWKDGSVFQAGPSSAMNWYGTGGDGSQTGVGTRASDGDSMCGNAVMYDAVAGNILTVGGSPDYQNAGATAAAHTITIGDPGSTPQVTTLDNMAYPRIFHNSVVLPDGTVFIMGGQSIGSPFFDTNVEFTPELWDPATKQFTQLVPNSTPRVYHSFALLMQDGTVITGGGGLCDTCSSNHFDAQIYTPQYLLNSDGSPADRPSITGLSSNNVVPGDTITVNTDTAVTSIALIRYGSTTHTVNTDQRRIPLPLTSAGTNSYRVTIPNDYGIALPGFWMLFAMDGNGRPSTAWSIVIAAP